MFQRFRRGLKPPEELGRDRDYNIDLVPKFMMASGELVDILIATEVTRYLEFVQVAGSYVYRAGTGVCKVPSTATEVLSSSLLGFFEKTRFKSFMEFVQGVDPVERSTWKKHDLARMLFAELVKAFGLEGDTVEAIGHALALHLDDLYLTQPALPTVMRIQLYMRSMLRYGKSPYIYPLYGLGELPQGFARLSAIHGGTFMLDTTIDEIILDKESGRVCGVRSGEKIAKCKTVFADPSYAPDRARPVHRVVRAICLLKHAVPSTNSSDSCQIILPKRQVKRRHYDIYIAVLSSAHNVCPAGHWLASISTIMEGEDPEAEVAPAMALLGPVHDHFISISTMYEPTAPGTDDGLFISRSYDATSHFETVTDDVKELYMRYAGKTLVLPRKEPRLDAEE